MTEPPVLLDDLNEIYRRVFREVAEVSAELFKYAEEHGLFMQQSNGLPC